VCAIIAHNFRSADRPTRSMNKLGLLAISLALAAPSVAEAGFTVHGGAGAAYIVAGSDSRRTPATLELAPGWDFNWARIELPFVFGLAGEGAFPEAPNVFLGIRPGLKLFPVKWLYGKLATQLYFPGGEAKRDVYLGASIGGGFEARFAGVFALNAELNFNPFFTPEAVLPIEGRVGATFLF
jgi:hypothetical protein